MKAEIDEKGKLTIIAETPVEGFAIQVWFCAYNEKKTIPLFENRCPVIEINTIDYPGVD